MGFTWVCKKKTVEEHQAFPINKALLADYVRDYEYAEVPTYTYQKLHMKDVVRITYQWQTFDVPIVPIPMPKNARFKWLWLCPLCGQRAHKLYYSDKYGGVIACRKNCLDLVYQQQKDRFFALPKWMEETWSSSS